MVGIRLKILKRIANIFLTGCIIREHHVNNVGKDGGEDMVEQVTWENAQTCTEHCVNNKEGLFWTYQNRTCTVRKSIKSRGGGLGTQRLATGNVFFSP